MSRDPDDRLPASGGAGSPPTVDLGAQLLESAPLVIVELGSDWQIRYANPFTEELTGWGVEELRGRDWLSTFVPEREHDRMRGLFRMAITGASPRVEISPIVTRSGEERLIEWNHRSRAPGVLAIGTDVTMRVRADELHRRTREELEATLAAIPDLLFEVDEDGRLLDFRAKRREQLAVPPEDFIGRTFHDVLPVAAADACLAAIREASRHGFGLGPTYMLEMPDGEMWFEPSAARKAEGPAERATFVLLVRDVTARMRVEAANATLMDSLRQRDGLLRAVLDAGPVAIFAHDLDGRFTFASGSALSLIGLSPGDLLGQSAFDLYAHIPGLVERLRGALAGETVTTKAKFGSMSFDVTYTPLVDSTGQIAGAFSLAVDVSERVRAQEATRQSEERLREAQRIGRMGSLDMNLSDNTVLISDETRILFGLSVGDKQPSLEELLSRVHPDDRDRVTRSLEAAVGGIAKHDLEHRMVRPDGSEVHVRATAELIPAQDGRPARLIGTVHDITALKRAYEALRQSEDLFRATFDGAAVGLMLTRGIVPLRVNDAFARVLGYTSEELAQLGSDAQSEINFPEDRESAHVLASDVMAGRRAGFLAEKRYRHKDGSEVWAHVSATKIPGANEGPPDSLVQIVDITARKQAEDAVRQLNATLEQRVAERTALLEATNKELETFTYTVSHDLKAPLRGIDGYSQLLMADHAKSLDEEGRSFLATIRAAAKQMNQLIEDLLLYSRVERSEQRPVPVDVGALVDTLLAEHAGEIKRRGVTVLAATASGTIKADRAALALAVRNLVDNALKFTKDVSAPTLEIGGRRDASVFLLWVRDNGVGFDMRFHDRLFQVFQRLHRAEEYPGTGVGLAIVEKAMNRMGGRVWAESEPGRGTTFFLEIPQ